MRIMRLMLFDPVRWCGADTASATAHTYHRTPIYFLLIVLHKNSSKGREKLQPPPPLRKKHVARFFFCFFFFVRRTFSRFVISQPSWGLVMGFAVGFPGF